MWYISYFTSNINIRYIKLTFKVLLNRFNTCHELKFNYKKC